MRVVQYHPRALVGDGGVSRSVRRLSSAMVSGDADVVITYDAATGQPEATSGPSWRPVRHRGPAMARIPTRFAEALAGADVLVLNSAWTAHNAWAGAAARRATVPYVVAHRGAYDPLILQRRPRLKRMWWTALEGRLVRGACAVHVFFDEQAEPLRALGYRGHILVAPNGVTAPEDRSWDGGTGSYVAYVGRFDPEHKGLDLLVRAVHRLPEDDRPTLRLHGPDWRGGKDRLAELVATLGVERWVRIGEPVYGAEKWGLIAAATAFVYPSRWEGFGNAPAEAAALGVPTLVTPYPLGRFLAERGAALLVDAEVDALAAGLQALQAGVDPAIGQRARQLVRTELTWEAVARSWLDQLEDLV